MPFRQTPPVGPKKRVAALRDESSTRGQTGEKKTDTITVSLRIPRAMLKEIDEAVKARPYRMPRHMWLLEAIHEKLMRLHSNPR